MSIDLDSINLDSGGHSPADGKGCVMEWVGVMWLMENQNLDFLEAWTQLTDAPPAECTIPIIRNAAIRTNDRLGDVGRQRLRPFIPRLMNARRPMDDEKYQRVTVRLAAWSARRVLHLILDDERRAVALRAIETAEAWLRGEATKQDCRVAADAAWAARDAAAAAVAAAAADAAAAAAAVAAAAADAAAAAVAAGREDALIEFLDDLLDQYEKAMAEEGALVEACA